jgi:hypothetical protein
LLGPEGKQHQYHQQVAVAKRQVRQQIGHRIAEQHAENRDRGADPEGADPNGIEAGQQVELPVLGFPDDGAFGVSSQIQGLEIIGRRVTFPGVLDGHPHVPVAPFLGDLEECLLPLSLHEGSDLHAADLAPGLGHETAHAALVVVQPGGDFADGAGLGGPGDFLGEYRVDLLRRRRCAGGIPVLERGDGFREFLDDHRVVEAEVHHLRDGRQEGEGDERQQRHHQQECADFVSSFGLGQRCLQALAAHDLVGL